MSSGIRTDLALESRELNPDIEGVEEDKAAVESAYVNAVSTVDKAAGKGVIHKNAANRKKAQLAIKLAAK